MEPNTPPSSAAKGSSSRDRLAALFARRNYELMGELGRGGMGIVYLAKDRKLDRKVAIKTLSPERATRENSLRRFEREARTFASIRHPHIATLYEFEDEGPLQYLALEYIDGYDLESERRRGKKWSSDEAARIIQTVASALDHTHSKGILHRDIKPGNILIERESNRVVLTDFGLAKGRNDETLTASGFAVGTPAYMAPEQITDQFNVQPDGRADIFSLGTVFYEMITGKHPFIGADDLKTMRNIVHVDPVPPRDIDPSIPEELQQIIFGMLAKKPDTRVARARDVYRQLAKWLHNREATGVMQAIDIPPPQHVEEDSSQGGRRGAVSASDSKGPASAQPAAAAPAPAPAKGAGAPAQPAPPAMPVPPPAPPTFGDLIRQHRVALAVLAVTMLAIGVGLALVAVKLLGSG